MNAVEIQSHAQKLYQAHGTKALTEVAEKVRQFESRGEKEQAQDWKRIEQALQQMRGPNAS
jgi:hypothetical protein